jgi:glycosyltransferase involved in cell wall biosynthesis
MRIGVVVATFNRPDALVRVLRGLVAQTRPPDEILIADDGSGPSTQACVADFQKGSPVPVRHVWHPDEGFRLAGIRNRAIRESRSDYLVFLDGDCIPEPHFIQDHARLARPGYFFQGKRVLVEQALAAGFDHRSLAGGRLRWLFCRHLSNRHHLVYLPWMPALPSRRLEGVRGCNMGIWRHDLLAVNGFNEDFTGWGREDSELVVRLYHYGLKRLDHGFAAICFHLWHPDYTRDEISRNDRLLADARASGRWTCANGIVRLPDGAGTTGRSA